MKFIIEYQKFNELDLLQDKTIDSLDNEIIKPSMLPLASISIFKTSLSKDSSERPTNTL